MSIDALRWSFDCKLDKSSEKLVLIALSNYASQDGNAWPSITTINRITGLNRKTIISALDSLEEKTFIKDVSTKTGLVKVYQLNLEQTDISEPVPFLPEPVPFLPLGSTENGTHNLYINQKEPIYKPTSTKNSIPEGFVRFWEAYPKCPRKGGKGKCIEIWKRKRYEPDTDKIIAHLEFVAKEWAKQNNEYAPAPSSYLNLQGWDGWEPIIENRWVNK